MSDTDPASSDGECASAETEHSLSDAAPSEADDVPSFDELSLVQRVAVAWVQDPIRGVVVLFLFLFALSFLVAFAMWLV